jgi:hypothetical protein
MNTFKNLLIAILTGLLALSLFTQPAQSAPAKSSPVTLTKADLITIAQSVPILSLKDQTKLIEYRLCLEHTNAGKSSSPAVRFGSRADVALPQALAECAFSKP